MGVGLMLQYCNDVASNEEEARCSLVVPNI